MFNQDIKHLFMDLPVDPTEAFMTKLHSQLVPQPTTRRVVHPFRLLAVAGSALAVILGIALSWQPVNINLALAESIVKTFSFQPTGYHHLKMQVERYDPGFDVMRTSTSETWTDGTHAIIEVDQRASGWNLNSFYYDSDDYVSCSVSLYAEDTPDPTCDVPQFLTEEMRNERPQETEALPLIGSPTIENAQDTHGDLYLTWVTNRPLDTTTIDISRGSYGYVSAGWSGTYGWQNDAGEYVHRVTWFSDDMLQSSFENETNTSFLIQIKELGPDNYGMSGPSGPPITQSQVYLVDVTTMTVTPMTDAWLATSRDTFNHKLLQSTVSTETITREYEMSYRNVLDLGQHLDAYTLTSQTKGNEDGQHVEYITYDLGANGPAIDTVSATRAEFARDADSHLILWMKLYDVSGKLIYHVKLLAFEESTAAPEGLFTIDAWKAHVKSLK